MQSVYVRFAALAFVAALTGCAAPGVNLADTGRIVLEVEKTKGVYVAWARVVEQDEGLFVIGAVKYTRSAKLKPAGYVHVTIARADGSLVGETRITCVISRKKCPPCGTKLFKQRLSIAPPVGATIRFRYHPAA